MRILHREPREGLIRLRTETLDDLWELSHIIGAGDSVRAKTERKVAVGADRAKQVRKPMTLTIEVENVVLEHGILRIQGLIRAGPEDLISFGDHHTLGIETNTELELTKQWDALTKERLEQAAKAQPLNILLVIFDRSQAELVELTRRGHAVVNTLSGEVSKKQPGGGKENFWKTIADAVRTHDERKKYASIVAASPAFWGDYLLNALPEGIRKRVTLASVSQTGEAGIREVLKRPEVSQVLEKDQNRKEEILVAQILEAVANDKACYGFGDCQEKVNLGQVKILLVTEEKVQTSREEGTYEQLDALLESTKQNGGEVHMLRHATDRIDALGGVAGVLRW